MTTSARRVTQDGSASSPVSHLDHSRVHYLAAYLGAVTAGLGQRGMGIHAVELMPTPEPLRCNITFDPPRQIAGFSALVWVAYQASWDEDRGWCCWLHHIANDQSKIRRFLGEPLVAAPEVVADFIAGLRQVQTPGPTRPVPYRRRAPQELADDLTRFTPSCTWIG